MNKMLIDTPTAEPVIVMKRSFNAPRRLVWRAFTMPEHVSRWWGARSMGTTRVVKLDLQPQGEWRFEQTAPDGAIYAFDEVDGKTEYTAITRFDSIEDRDGMVASGMETGAQESMDQLEELLAGLTAA